MSQCGLKSHIQDSVDIKIEVMSAICEYIDHAQSSFFHMFGLDRARKFIKEFKLIADDDITQQLLKLGDFLDNSGDSQESPWHYIASNLFSNKESFEKFGSSLFKDTIRFISNDHKLLKESFNANRDDIVDRSFKIAPKI